ncbi:MAG: ABC transporter permease subunit [Pirellulaceae bacterium]|nr:ABC transporter permease subunit [Pirellulaceae bacterium]
MTPPTEKQPHRKRRRARISRPGLSLLAEGEPMVWLTGGALMICLTMIVGLLGLVIWFGGATFWPLPVVEITLLDGKTRMGEITRSESFTVTRAAIDLMNEPVASAATQFLGNGDRASANRVLVRTGNFDITNEDFAWVRQFDTTDNWEIPATPEWAIVVERIEWGRFYGEPEKFVVHTKRDISADEAAIMEILQFFQVSPFRLNSKEQEDLRPQIASLENKMEELEKELFQIRRGNVRKFLEQFEAADDHTITAVLENGQVVNINDVTEEQNVLEMREEWSGPDDTWKQFGRYHNEVLQRFTERKKLTKHEIGDLNHLMEESRLNVRVAEINQNILLLSSLEELSSLEFELSALEDAKDLDRAALESIRSRYAAGEEIIEIAARLAASLERAIERQADRPQTRADEIRTQITQTQAVTQELTSAYLDIHRQAAQQRQEIQAKIDVLRLANERYEIHFATADKTPKMLKLNEIVRAYPANQLKFSDKLAIYISRWGEFLNADPREANSEGGVFPAIWGTVAMTLIMSFFVVPFGVLAALYLKEYASAGIVVSAVRIAINNLAGVPSIVFGVFGLGFFCYIMGSYIDAGPQGPGFTPWPPATWFLYLGLAVGAGTVAFVSGFLSSKRPNLAVTKGQARMQYFSILLWMVSVVIVIFLFAKTPFFEGMYLAQVKDGNPTFGKGGLLWASLTLSLLTLPVVIVATEEALSAVPNSLREGSYACGASKWQTIRRIVLPHALPGIMTGMILAMARGAGEVAPLMLVGALKLAPELPLDLANWTGEIGPLPTGPIHPDRSFMHLGFHIFDLGFQSRNSEAAKPMVYTTTLLLIGIIVCLNLAAVGLRTKLRKRLQVSHF